MSKPTDPLSVLPWRVGRKLGRTIYAMVGAEPSVDNVLIGMMDSAELAGEACVAHNPAEPGAGGPSAHETSTR